tara:strand:- start:5173 stop:5388 length:216 start_codon:yes stop_codon:yes gene_type:complete
MKQKTPKPPVIAKVAEPAKKDQADLDVNMTDAETDGAIRKKKRKGKSGMTIDRAGAQYAGNGSGLNIPTNV